MSWFKVKLGWFGFVCHTKQPSYSIPPPAHRYLSLAAELLGGTTFLEETVGKERRRVFSVSRPEPPAALPLPGVAALRAPANPLAACCWLIPLAAERPICCLLLRSGPCCSCPSWCTAPGTTAAVCQLLQLAQGEPAGASSGRRCVARHPLPSSVSRGLTPATPDPWALHVPVNPLLFVEYRFVIIKTGLVSKI